MKAYWILFLCLSCVWTCGCVGTRKRQVNALERENSQLNGLLWEMEFQLESLEDENSDLKRRLADEDQDQGESEPRPRRAKEPVKAEPFDPGEFRPPTIEFPSEPSPDGTVPDSLLPGPTSARSPAVPGVSATSHEEPAILEPSIEVVPPEEVSLDSRRIKRIALAPLIGTLHSDNKPGDDGLVIVVEPWDGSNQMLADAARITVVLIDPAESGEAARYAQWQFDAKEAAKLFRDGDLPGLHLELPWPGDPPRHDQLHLFVRYTTSDGRQLEADSLVEVELGGRGRWVATEAPRLRPYEQPVQPANMAPTPPAIPHLLPADSVATEAKPVVPARSAPVRTVSAPRERFAEPSRQAREATETETRSQPNSSGDQMKPLPPRESAVKPEPEPPARRRPTWTPDRPW